MQVSSVQNYFLLSVALVYLWAFASLYHQIPGLYGDDGILPIRNHIKCDGDWLECGFLGDKPGILPLFHKWTGLSPSQTMELICILGIILASLATIFTAFRDCLVFAILWYFYFSCFQVGQTFLWFQWDTLLVECGFLTILVAPFRILRFHQGSLPHDRLTLFMVRWLVFRMMLASGLVKLTSECPTWWGLTALHYHFESQCIPTSLAWLAHQGPDWFKKLSVAATFIIEILIPPLFFAPVKHIRKMAFFTQIVLMVTIILTGNYNFFNLLYAAICIPILVDSSDSNLGSEVFRPKLGKYYSILKSILIGGLYGALIYWSIRLFDLRLANENGPMIISSDVAFSKGELYRTMAWTIPYCILLGIGLFIVEVASAFSRCWLDFKSRFHLVELWMSVQTVAISAICFWMFCISLVPFSWLDRGTSDMIWPKIQEWHSLSDKYQLTHSYGLFRHMTGVGGRPEVIVEGAADFKGPWFPYEFIYKPGNLARRPPFIIPHQPRLDWQMWFAALGSYQHNPWFISFIYRLLENQPEVLRLVAEKPFKDKPYKLIRARLFHYHFTSLNQSNKHFSRSDWWWREDQGEYFPVVDLENQSIIDYMRKRGMLIQKSARVEDPNLWMAKILKTLRKAAELTEASQFVWSLTAAAILALIGKGFEKQ